MFEDITIYMETSKHTWKYAVPHYRGEKTHRMPPVAEHSLQKSH